MTIEQRYLAAQFQDVYRVLRWRMKPLTLGHVCLLKRLNSPFLVIPGENEKPPLPGPGDLRVAIALCSRSYPAALRFIDSPLLKWRLRLMNCRPLAQGIIQMMRYLTAAMDIPDVWHDEDSGGRAAGAPFLQLVKLTHMLHLGKTELQTLCTPYAMARWDYVATWELQGALRIVSDQDIAAIERAKELAEKNKIAREGAGRVPSRGDAPGQGTGPATSPPSPPSREN